MRDQESGAEDIEGLVAAWHVYGEQFTVFAPAQQPALSTCEPDVPRFEERGLARFSTDLYRLFHD